MRPFVSKHEEAEGLRLAAAQPESAAKLLAFLDGVRERLIAAVREEDRVRSRLDGRLSRVVGVDYREDKVGAHVRRLAEVGFYDYNSDVVLVAVVHPLAGELLDLEERQGLQPPITDEERTEAIRIAGLAGSMAVSESTSTGAVAFPTPNHRLTEDRSGHRCCSLYTPSERAPGESDEIVVDLSAEDVVAKSELRPGPSHSGAATEGET